MGAGGDAGSTTVNVPPQLGQLGSETTDLAHKEATFLGEGLSLGNYGIALATGGQGQQITAPGVNLYDVPRGTITQGGPAWGALTENAGGGSGGTTGGTGAAGSGQPMQAYLPGGVSGDFVSVGNNYYQQSGKVGPNYPFYNLYNSGSGWQGATEVPAPSQNQAASPPASAATPVAQGDQQSLSTQVGGVNVPTQNPLYGPWINAAVSGMQNEAAGAGTLEGMIGTAGERGQTYFNESQNLSGQLDQLLKGTGLLPSQQAYVDASVKSGQSQIAQQLASEGMSASTLGPELSAEIGLQGAATAGQLVQGNISTLSQAAQGWAHLAQGEEAVGFGEQQALTNLFSTIAAQGSAMQNQFWQQGLQGYGLEGAFFNNTLAAYGTSLQAYNSILQGSEVQAQVNASIENANTAANAAIIGDVIQGVSSIASSALSSFCWVARAVFGQDNPRWMLFRFWMVHKAPRWLLRLYTRNGPRWAQWISDKPIWKFVVRCLMNLVIEYGG